MILNTICFIWYISWVLLGVHRNSLTGYKIIETEYLLITKTYLINVNFLSKHEVYIFAWQWKCNFEDEAHMWSSNSIPFLSLPLQALYPSLRQPVFHRTFYCGPPAALPVNDSLTPHSLISLSTRSSCSDTLDFDLM